MFGLFLFGLLSSIGTSCMWLSLGPFSQTIGGLGEAGTLGMIRQLMFLAGALISGPWADRGRPLRKCLYLEIAQVFVGLSLFLAFQMDFEVDAMQLEVWSALRFFLGGGAFVTGFKIFGKAGSSLGNSSITHLLTTQGSVLFGALLSIFAPTWSSHAFNFALQVDILTSLLLVIVLIRLLNGSYDEAVEPSKGNTSSSVLTAMTGFWNFEFRTWSIFQLVFLVGASGFVVTALYVSSRQHLLSYQTAYSTFSALYGLGLWVMGVIHLKGKNPFFLGTVSIMGFILSGILLSFEGFVGQYGLIFGMLLYAFAMASLLHLTNKQILERALPSQSATIRSGMLFYLSCAFGLGEKVLGELLSVPNGAFFVGGLRTLTGLALLAIFTLNYKKQFAKETLNT